MNHQSFEPKIVLQVYDFYLKFYLEIKKWPKPERYNLGRRCEDLVFDVLENLISASRARQKEHFLFTANIKLQILKNLIRLAKEIQILPSRKYLFFQKELDEIGRMLGGWLKSV